MKSAKKVLDTVRINGIDYPQYVDGLTHKAEGFRYYTDELNLTNENVMSDCHILKMRRIEQLTGRPIIMWIGIKFDEAIEKNNFSVVLQLQGETLASHRHIQRHKFYHSGDTIDEFSSDYIVELKKRVMVEEDVSNTCRNYPNEDFETYMDCDDMFMAETLRNITDGLNVIPPWLNDNLDDVTVTPVPWLNASWPKYKRVLSLYNGGIAGCPLPCTTFQTETRFLQKDPTQYSHQFGLTFDSTVEVTNTVMMKPTMSNFLSQVGGSLGLWLGLGVLQILALFQPIIKTLEACRKGIINIKG